jgi:hypothetical protein
MELDTDKIDQAALALLALGRHEGYRAWKAFDWEVMGRLHVKGYITDPWVKRNRFSLPRTAHGNRSGSCKPCSVDRPIEAHRDHLRSVRCPMKRKSALRCPRDDRDRSGLRSRTRAVTAQGYVIASRKVIP